MKFILIISIILLINSCITVNKYYETKIVRDTVIVQDDLIISNYRLPESDKIYYRTVPFIDSGAKPFLNISDTLYYHKFYNFN